MNEFLRVDLFTEIVESLPPAYLQRTGNFYSVCIQFDTHWVKSQTEDLGRTHFEITFYRSKDKNSWEFEVDHKGTRYPAELIVHTIRRLPKVGSVDSSFVILPVSECTTAVLCPKFGDDVPTTVATRNVMFHKAFFDNPNGGRARLDWTIRLGRKEIDD